VTNLPHENMLVAKANKSLSVINALFGALLLADLARGFTIRHVDTSRQFNPTHLFATSASGGSNKGGQALIGLKVGIVGGGPSGLLVAHRLLAGGASVELYEARKDPRKSKDLEGRAYALGIGIRGRTAIQSVDNPLWEAVKAKGFESDRFTLYIRDFPIKLRDGPQDVGSQPSVLMYQSDLCAALLDELESRQYGNRLSLKFEQGVKGCDFDVMALELGDNRRVTGFDCIIGCDGVNSIVRSSIASSCSSFECQKNSLPGEFKVCRLTLTPAKLDPTSVSLIVPRAGTTTAFVEPTADGCCILFAGRGGDVILDPPADLDRTVEALAEAFPLLNDLDFRLVAEQLANQRSGTAASVVCNTYHYGSAAALCGDAAHATGGVSGQGVNSALVDSAVLGDLVVQEFNPKEKALSLQTALLKYSQKQVPEGKALYDLSFGPKPEGFLKLRFLARNALSTVFQGRFGIGAKPLQTMLTTSTRTFADIRRELDIYYDKPFPDQKAYNDMLAHVNEESKVVKS
jgi:kynurenine 3-monooxygenase